MEKERWVLTVSEAGKLLGVSRAHAYMLANTSQIPTLRLGRRLVVPRIALEKMLESAGIQRSSNG